MTPDEPLKLTEGRFARLEAIEWWEQKRLAEARVLVVGAGALGNEVVKDLALLGVGRLLIADMDRIELSNLSRSVLFRAEDSGQLKASRAARAAAEIYPEMLVESLNGNVMADLGMAAFRWADVVIGALDNREARVFLNSTCARVGRPWIDGGIEVFRGVARGFGPPATACYECTMNRTDWDLLNKRRSCSLLARRALQERGTPTTPTIASIIAGVQVQEAVRLLHGDTRFLGKGFFYDGPSLTGYPIDYEIHEECLCHEPASPVVSCPELTSASSAQEVLVRAEKELGTVTELEFSRQLVSEMVCPQCRNRRDAWAPPLRLSAQQAWCDACSCERTPELLHCLRPDDARLSMTLAELGLPRWDIVWARRGHDYVGLEISGDALLESTSAGAEATDNHRAGAASSDGR